MTVHDFGERLAYSHSQSDKPWWEIVYRQAFPDLLAIADLRRDGWHQRAGRDRALVMVNGKTIYVDEKCREKHYGDDIAVEVWSRYPPSGGPPYGPTDRAEPGWACKPLDCDFLAYAVEPTQTCYLFPYQGIRSAWRKHGAVWVRNANQDANGFRWIRARNSSYVTISIAVPTWLLNEAITDALTVHWAVAAA